MLAFSWEEAINTCSHASTVPVSLVAAASPPVINDGEDQRGGELPIGSTPKPFTGSKSTALQTPKPK